MKAILAIVGSLLTIIIWIGSHKRKRASRMAKILQLLKSREYDLGQALQKDDTVGVTLLKVELCDLRNEYRHLASKK